MPPEIDPLEKKSYSKALFLCGLIFFLVSNWVFYDEVISRRSWKSYQSAFNKLELKKLSEEYEKTRQALEAADAEKDKLPEPPPGAPMDESQWSLRKIRLKLEAAEVRMDSSAYKKALKDVHERLIRLSDAKQNFGFAKADQDQTFYEWKHSLEENHQAEAEKYKKKYYELEGQLVELKKKVNESEASVAEVQSIINGYVNEVKKWQKAEKTLQEPLAKLQKKMDGVKSRTDDIKQVVIDDLGKGGVIQWGTVDRCESCHVAINRDGFENEKNPFKTHPHRTEIFGKHPVENFGCTTCHGGQGRATQIKGKPLEKGDFVHGYVRHWPDPLLRADFQQATCNKCHQDQWNLNYAPTYMAGKKLFWNLGCTGCHAVKGFENAPKVGPSLRKVADKVEQEWMIEWIKNPKGYLPHARMPKPPLDIEEPGQTEKVAAYILQNSEKFDFPFGKFYGGNAAEGQKIFETVGCYGCHALGGKGAPLASALDRIAQKTTADWLYNWIQDPKKYNPEAKMPNLRLTPQEAANITAYLISYSESQPAGAGKSLPVNETLRASLKDPENAKKGFVVISQYGCYGCHNIKGFESASKLSVELTTFARKAPTELDFGDSKIPHTWLDWTMGKLKDPRMYLTERTSSKMPNFELSDGDLHALVVFLKGLKKEEVPERYLMTKQNPRQLEIDEGRRLVQRLNCRGCHTIEGEGRLIEQTIGSDKAPPVLDGIGARVRPDWLFRFLKNPESMKVRPWIDVRMPTFQFTDAQVNAIISYFSALDKVPSSFSTIPIVPPSPEMLAAGAKLASKDYFSCLSCHIQNGQTPASSPEQWGPDFALAHDRIRYDFIQEWVKDPQKFTPGVKMPAFLPSDDAAPQDILGGDRQKQAEALRDYIMSLGR